MDKIINLNEIKITPEILNLIAEIDEFKGVWQHVGRLTPDRLSSLKKVATIESIGSSTRIEGSRLSDRQVETLLSQLNVQSLHSRDEQEVAGYAYACEKIIEYFDALPITENNIKQMHVWLLQHSDKDERHRGEYKKIPIQIEAFDHFGKSMGVIFETTSPLETPIQMHDLIVWTRQSLENRSLHPLLVIGLFVVIFLAIHPFQDGNGRLSRLLTTWLMMRSGYYYIPYSSLESVIEANKESYYLALQKAQKSWQNHQPDWTSWLLFFLKCLQRQKHHLEVKLSKEQILMKKRSLLATQIIKLLEEHGELKINEIQALIQVNRNTLKKALVLLVKEQSITMHGKGKGTWYTL